jgi:hypothetical protein
MREKEPGDAFGPPRLALFEMAGQRLTASYTEYVEPAFTIGVRAVTSRSFCFAAILCGRERALLA